MLKLLLAVLIFCPVIALASTEVYVTSYNPEVGQTDNDPCTGASGLNLCVQRAVHRYLAVSRDLLARNGGLFAWGDRVILRSENPACYGVFIIEDTMNARFKLRADIFFKERKHNTNCQATIHPLRKS